MMPRRKSVRDFVLLVLFVSVLTIVGIKLLCIAVDREAAQTAEVGK
jgi:hypothetical protein